MPSGWTALSAEKAPTTSQVHQHGHSARHVRRPRRVRWGGHQTLSLRYFLYVLGRRSPAMEPHWGNLAMVRVFERSPYLSAILLIASILAFSTAANAADV